MQIAMDFRGLQLSESILTPYTVSLVLLVNHYCTESFKNKHNLAVILFDCIKYKNLSLSELVSALNTVDDGKLGDEFTDYLEKAFTDTKLEVLKKLLGYGGTIQALMMGTNELVKPTSLFGLFLRHMILSFEISSYENLSKFLNDMRVYIEKKDTKCPILSVRHQKAYFSTEVRKFQKGIVMSESNIAIHKNICSMANNDKIQQAEYLHYLNYLSIKEYNLAKKHLHQYFTMMLNNCEEEKNIRPFSALNLAAIHSAFGHKEIAMRYLKESIHLGQLLGEQGCLSHCVSWMSFVQGSPIAAPSVSYELDTIPNDLELLSFCHVVEKKCKSGESPQDVIKYLNDVAPYLTRSQFNTNAAQLYRLYGNSLLSELFPFFSLIQLCHKWFLGSHMITFSHDVTGLCLALCNIALVLSKTNCALVHSTELLNFTKTLFPPFSPHQDIILLTLNRIKFRLQDGSVKREEVRKVIRSISEVVYSSLTETSLPETVEWCSDEYMTSVEYEANVLYNSAKATQKITPNVTIESLLSLILHCQKYNLHEYELRAYLLLSETQLQLRLFEQASETIQAAFIEALASNDVFIQSMARWLYCQTELAIAGPSERLTTFKTVYRHLTSALETLAELGYTQLVTDILYYITRLYHEFDMKDERNKCAKRFRVYLSTRVLDTC